MIIDYYLKNGAKKIVQIASKFRSLIFKSKRVVTANQNKGDTNLRNGLRTFLKNKLQSSIYILFKEVHHVIL